MIDSGFLNTDDKKKIAYNWYKNDKPKAVVIVHGFFNSKDSVLLKGLAEYLSKKQDVFIFDLRGHGGSEGCFTWTSEEWRELNAVLDFLKDKYDSVNVIGFSMGGSICINVLSGNKYKIDSFICISAPSDCSRIDYKWWQLDIENDIGYLLFTREGMQGKGIRPGPFWLAKEKPVDNAGKLKMPVLYIHGDKDWVVGKWHSEALFKKTNTDKKILIIKNGPHAEYLMRKHQGELLPAIDEWLDAARPGAKYSLSAGQGRQSIDI